MTETAAEPLIRPLDDHGYDLLLKVRGDQHARYHGRCADIALAELVRMSRLLPNSRVELVVTEPLEHDEAFDLLAAQGVEMFSTEPGGRLYCSPPTGPDFGPFEDAVEAYFTIMAR